MSETTRIKDGERVAWRRRVPGGLSAVTLGVVRGYVWRVNAWRYRVESGDGHTYWPRASEVVAGNPDAKRVPLTE